MSKKKKTTEIPQEKIKTGRRPAFKKEIGVYICEHLMRGRSLTSILKDKGMPTMPTVYAWLNKNSKTYEPDFLEAYVMAREIQAEVLADEIKDIADDGSNDTYKVYNEKTKKLETKTDIDHIKRSQLRVESRKWLAAHLLPRKYSDKMQITGSEGKDLIPQVPTNITFNFVKKEKKDE